jgi:hypothetical protein
MRPRFVDESLHREGLGKQGMTGAKPDRLGDTQSNPGKWHRGEGAYQASILD